MFDGPKRLPTKSGEFDRALYKYKADNVTEKSVGLVVWKDSKPVYVLSTDYVTDVIDTCNRRVKGVGVITISRFELVNKYNTSMGG